MPLQEIDGGDVPNTGEKLFTAIQKIKNNFNFLNEIIREPLTANRTYYVRSDGDDGNTGLTDSPGGAFLTIQRAINEVVETLDRREFTVTIQVRSGTFGRFQLYRGVGAQPIVLQGDTGTPSNVVLSSADSIGTIYGDGAGAWDVKGFRILSTNDHGIDVLGDTFLQFGSIEFGSVAHGHIRTRRGARAVATANYSITGGADYHWFVGQNSTLEGYSRTITLTGTPAFSRAFAISRHGSALTWQDATFSGSATGRRFEAGTGGIIDTNGAGASYFPGDAIGILLSGGSYDDDVGTSGKLNIGTESTNFNQFFAKLNIGAVLNSLTAGAGNLYAHLVKTDGGDGTGPGLGFAATADEENVGAKIVHERTGANSQGHLDFYTKPNTTLGDTTVRRLRVTDLGSIVAGIAALATNATNGFMYVPTCAGTPTGTPTAQTGTVPIVVDVTNHKLYFYSGGAWRDAGP